MARVSELDDPAECLLALDVDSWLLVGIVVGDKVASIFSIRTFPLSG